MPAVPAGYTSSGQIHKPNCFNRIKIGFTMGFTVGMVTGIVFGGYAALRNVIIQYMFLEILIFFIFVLDKVHVVVNFFQ
jgi:hypothetical protein